MSARILISMAVLPEHPDMTAAQRLVLVDSEVREVMGHVEEQLHNRATEFSNGGWEVDSAYEDAATDRYDVIFPQVGPPVVVGKLRITRGS